MAIFNFTKALNGVFVTNKELIANINNFIFLFMVIPPCLNLINIEHEIILLKIRG